MHMAYFKQKEWSTLLLFALWSSHSWPTVTKSEPEAALPNICCLVGVLLCNYYHLIEGGYSWCYKDTDNYSNKDKVWADLYVVGNVVDIQHYMACADMCIVLQWYSSELDLVEFCVVLLHSQ